MAFFVPTRFVWRFGGRAVHLCGSFTRWVETIPMAPVEGTPGAFAVVVHLPPGYHQYKFIVDGKWMHDETAPYMPDPLGNVNNWLFVRKIEPPPQQPVAGITFEQQQQLLQQQQQQQLQQQAEQQQQAQQQQQQQQQAVAAAAAAAALLQQQQQQQQHLVAAAQQVVAAQQRSQVAAQQQQQQQAQAHAQAQQQQAGIMQAPRAQAIPTSPTALSGAAGGGSAAGGPGASVAVGSTLAGGGGLGGGAGGSGAGGSGGGDVDMVPADSSVVAPIITQSDREPDLTKKKVSDFLHAHSAYELIPESGKVVVLDCDLPVRQAFHALHEQGCASAPIWDGREGTIVGVVSASDFIHTLQRLRTAVSRGGNNPLSEAEMDAHTIRGMREAAALEGSPPKPLVYVKPEDNLAKVVRTLFQARCSMAPILSCDPGGLEVPSVLHIATLGGVTACLMRHFRASLASLPLLAQPLCSLALGTWSEEAVGEDDAAAYRQRQQQAVAMMMARRADSGRGGQAPGGGPGQANGGCAQDGGGGKGGGGGALRVRPLQMVHPSTPLTAALGLLLEAGVSALPVVDERGVLLDVYARADITQLCRGNAYNRLQWEDVTVGQALSTAPSALPGWVQGSAHGVAGADGHQIGFGAGSSEAAVRGGSQLGGGAGMGKPGRVAVAARDDALRTVVERLSLPGVRRLVVVQRGTGRVEGVVSLSDVAALLFM